MSSLISSIGERVVTKVGVRGKLLGIIAGIAHIGTDEKKIVTARCGDVKLDVGSPPSNTPPVVTVPLSDKVEVTDELEVEQVEVPEEEGIFDAFFADVAEVVEEQNDAVDAAVAEIAAEAPEVLVDETIAVPENFTKAWLSETSVETLQAILDEYKDSMSKPRKAKIRKAIREKLG